MKEKKIKTINKMVITEVQDDNGVTLWYNVYTKEEWSMGKGYRYAEFEGCCLEEAISQAKHY
jgi:hypothetical protein